MMGSGILALGSGIHVLSIGPGTSWDVGSFSDPIGTLGEDW